MSFGFHTLAKIPDTIDDLRKLNSGIYKIKDKACIIISDNRCIRAVFTLKTHDIIHEIIARFDADYIFQSRIWLTTQEDLDRLLNFDFEKDTKTNKNTSSIKSHILCMNEREKNNGIPQIGVELELETDNERRNMDTDKLRAFRDLVVGTHNDPSVYQGVEINFTYGPINTWKIKQIKRLLRECKKQHLDNRYGTAGMHVHVSGKNALKVNRKIQENFQEIHDIIMPISSRRKDKVFNNIGTRYGTEGDCVRDQTNDFGTVEFRCFEATTDAKIFKRRLAFCRTLFLYLASDKPIKDFFNLIKPHEKENYKALLLDERNECAFGPSREDVLLKLN